MSLYQLVCGYAANVFPVMVDRQYEAIEHAQENHNVWISETTGKARKYLQKAFE